MQTGDYILQIIITDNLAKEKRKITTQFVQFELTHEFPDGQSVKY